MAEQTEVCTQCKRAFPAYLINPLVTNKGTFSQCPLCALENRNELHGLPPDTPFHGETAHYLWEKAKAYAEEHHDRSV